MYVVFRLDANPGPGAYESLSPRIPGPRMQKDFNPNATMLSRIPLKRQPGPGDHGYDIGFMSEQTSFIDTKKATKRGNKFGYQGRKVFDTSKSFTPGPGQYLAPSAFGHYMDKSAYLRQSHHQTTLS